MIEPSFPLLWVTFPVGYAALTHGKVLDESGIEYDEQYAFMD